MPIVKYFEIDEGLPEVVTEELKRFTAGRLVKWNDYQSYRDAAMNLFRRGKIKFSQSKLRKMVKDVADLWGERVVSDFNWAISNCYCWGRVDACNQAKQKAGSKFDEKAWWDAHDKANADGDYFYAYLFDWHTIDTMQEHPAVFLLDLLSKHDPKNKEAANRQQKNQD